MLQKMRFDKAVVVTTAVTLMLIGCFGDTFEPAWPDPGTIVASALAPNEVAVAVLICENERGHYRFEIKAYRSGDILAQTVISAPVGYHEHVVSVRWVDSRRAEATIDRDFGDNNIQATLSF